ncbi:MAG: ROK family protein, partial [Clostridia bacterium]
MAISGLAKIRDKNTLAVFGEIIKMHGVLRSEVSAKTGISLMTVGKIMEALLARGIIFEREHHTIAAGRKPLLAYPELEKWWCCAFSITDKISLDILSLDLKIIYSDTVALCGDDWTACFTSAISKAYEYIEANSLDFDACIGIGVSAPAPYNAALDRVMCPKRKNLESLRIKRLLREAFSTDIYIDEDVKLAALATLDSFPEYCGEKIFYMYVDVGVGGVLLINGEIYRGADEYAGDIGQLMFSNGMTVEDYLSLESLNEQLSAHSIDLNKGNTADDMALNGIVDDYTEKMAITVYNAT